MIGKINLNPTLARQFLSALYSSFFSQKSALAFMEVRGKAESGPMSFRRFYRSPEALLKDMAQWKPDLNYWIGVAEGSQQVVGPTKASGYLPASYWH